MSNRTYEANKAIAIAWAKEQLLIREGKGTRDWTFEQQQDILTRGKAYGGDGRAFEGHHMKSAEKSPEYQGDFDNIQFLSRQEHYSAHNGNFQNPTNGYFNPNTGETSDFGSNKYEPCKIIELSEPILCPTDGQTQSATENTSTSTNTSDVLITPGISNSEKSGFGGTVKRLTSKVANFYDRHKDVIHNVIASTPVIAAIVTEVIKGRTRGSSKNSTSPSLTDASIGNTTASIQHEDLVERASPSENTVPAHRQRYGKDKVWKDKESYVRGKNTDE